MAGSSTFLLILLAVIAPMIYSQTMKFMGKCSDSHGTVNTPNNDTNRSYLEILLEIKAKQPNIILGYEMREPGFFNFFGLRDGFFTNIVRCKNGNILKAQVGTTPINDGEYHFLSVVIYQTAIRYIVDREHQDYPISHFDCDSSTVSGDTDEYNNIYESIKAKQYITGDEDCYRRYRFYIPDRFIERLSQPNGINELIAP